LRIGNVVLFISTEIKVNLIYCSCLNRKVEFLEDFGMNVDEISTAQDEYQKLAQKLQNDRQAKAAAQMAQQQASATNASTDAR
jgi:hypothetical protein